MRLLEGLKRGDRPVFLDLVYDGVVVGTHVDEVADVITLLIGHIRVEARGGGVLASDVGGFANVSIVPDLCFISEVLTACWKRAHPAAAERQDDSGRVGCAHDYRPICRRREIELVGSALP